MRSPFAQLSTCNSASAALVERLSWKAARCLAHEMCYLGTALVEANACKAARNLAHAECNPGTTCSKTHKFCYADTVSCPCKTHAQKLHDCSCSCFQVAAVRPGLLVPPERLESNEAAGNPKFGSPKDPMRLAWSMASTGGTGQAIATSWASEGAADTKMGLYLFTTCCRSRAAAKNEGSVNHSTCMVLQETHALPPCSHSKNTAVVSSGASSACGTPSAEALDCRGSCHATTECLEEAAHADAL